MRDDAVLRRALPLGRGLGRRWQWASGDVMLVFMLLLRSSCGSVRA